MSTASVSLASILDEVFMVLTEKERNVIIKRFALDGKIRETLESIGQKFNVTRERIRQIEAKALAKLRKHKDAKKLHDYIK